MGHLRLKCTFNGFYLVPASLGRDEVMQYKAENASGCTLALYSTVKTLKDEVRLLSFKSAFRNCFPLFF